MGSEEIDRSLETLIDPWLNHMRWRSDFADWRKKRLWQEKYQSEALAEISQYSLANSEHRVLDLGSGMGGFAVAYALSSNGAQGKRLSEAPNERAVARPVVAMDYNLAYCEIAKTRARRYDIDLPTLVAAGENLPFAGEEFGVLTCWDVVEHVQNPERLFSEIERVLKPGGTAFVTVINRYALVDPHYHLRFINWIPRSWAEKYIEFRRRTKDSPLQDMQRLQDMHYFTYGQVLKLIAGFGMQTRDLQVIHSRFNRLPRALGSPLYRVWRTFGMGTYRLLLTKVIPS